jgi:predicted nucleotidyltransferase
MEAAREELLDRIVETLGEESAIAAAYLFGSVGRGTATNLSDVDLAIVLEPGLDVHQRGSLLRHVTMLMGHACPGRAFDIRCLDELPAAIAGRVVTEGRLVFERDPALRVAAGVRARMMYHDFLPFELQGDSAGLGGLRGRLGLG